MTSLAAATPPGGTIPHPSRSLRVKLFLDGANLEQMKAAYLASAVQGYTTNPTLMRKAGVRDYVGFAMDVLRTIPDRPVSFEVFSDDMASMAAEARVIAAWPGIPYVKVPVTNTKGEPTTELIRRLSDEGLRLNVTAVFTLDQVRAVREALAQTAPAVVSVFAGRIADTGVDPVPLMREAVEIMKERPLAEVLWASPRELLNVFHAEMAGCHIITATGDLVAKMALVGKDLREFSLETVRMFYEDARACGFQLVP